MKKRPSSSPTWPSVLALVLALPVTATLAACDTSSKPSSTCAGGKTGLAAAATCTPNMTPTTPGATTPGATTPGATTPGPTTPPASQLGPTTNNADLVGDWGLSGSNNKGQVWTFDADGTYAVVSYQLAGTSANIEVTLAGRYAAANGMMAVTAERSTCVAKASQDSLPYTIAGNQLTVNLGGGTVYTYTKDNAPNSNDFTVVPGCFDRMSGVFAQSALMTLQ
jgi:hypothetical protein